ncbi:MAG: insulinase family protein [Patescibacteria group bacterium]|nr:insulinase family protein [Patescibacteria group bacterium]
MKTKGWVKMKAECGAPIWVNYDKTKKSAAISALVLAGGCDEKWPKQAGIAHAMEHMVFQGTQHFAGSEALTRRIESCGGSLNAFTSYELTYFYSVLPVKLAERGFIHLREMLLLPSIEPKNVKTEMKNIIQEIKRSDNNPDEVAEQAFMKAVYGKHPFANPVIGIKESVNNFRREDFLKWKEDMYYPENFTFIITGGLEPGKAKDLIDKMFNISPTGKSPNIRNFSVDLVGNTPRFLFVPRNDWQQSLIFMGTTIGAGDSSETLVLDFFTDMLNGMSGPLFQEVRDKRGLAYSVRSQTYNSLKLLSPIMIYAGTDPSKCEEVAKIVRMVIDKSKNSKSLFKATMKKVEWLLDIQRDSLSPIRIANSAAYDIIVYGHPVTFENLKKRIRSITIDQIEAAVNKYLNPDRLTTVVVGPEPKK